MKMHAEIAVCALRVYMHSATDHSNVLVPLEILLVCLCKQHHAPAPSWEPWDGNLEVKYFSFTPEVHNVPRLWTIMSTPWGLSGVLTESKRLLFPSQELWAAASHWCLSGCPQTPSPALLYANQELAFTSSLTPVLPISAHRWSCTVQKTVQLPESLENISWHKNLCGLRGNGYTAVRFVFVFVFLVFFLLEC